MEIERRFLLQSEIEIDALVHSLPYKFIRQGYLYVDTTSDTCMRIRVIDDLAFLTIKKKVTSLSTEEFEYPIPYEDALYMLDTMIHGYIIQKKRYYYKNVQGMLFEIDVFVEDNIGLSIIEVELPDENFPIILPNWVGEEITAKQEYTNAMLAKNPFTLWT